MWHDVIFSASRPLFEWPEGQWGCNRTSVVILIGSISSQVEEKSKEQRLIEVHLDAGCFNGVCVCSLSSICPFNKTWNETRYAEWGYNIVLCWLFIDTIFDSIFVADCKFNCHKKCAALAPKDCQGYSKYASYVSSKSCLLLVFLATYDKNTGVYFTFIKSL